MANRVRFLAEAGVGGAAAVLGILTLVWPGWIEAVTGLEPDHGDGSAEWVVALALLLVALALGALARADRRRLGRAPSPATDVAAG